LTHSQNWTDENNSPVCADESPFTVWTNWDASQRDLFVLDFSGNLILHQNVSIGLPDDLEQIVLNLTQESVAIDVEINPNVFKLYQNYPNPFNPKTWIRFDLFEDSEVKINIYDVLGRSIRLLLDSHQVAGQNSVQWNGKDEFDQTVSSGVYIYHLQVGKSKSMKKMLLIN
tara:strand:- start:178 stop:690 length:513 start_codon:yes stop_codon:yes gene_type:complete